MKRGLVIQGPLISRGRHGGSAHISASNVADVDIVTHFCHADVDGLIEASLRLFEAGIVVATWEGEPSHDFLGAYRLELPPFPAPPRGRNLHEAVASNNKLRQFRLSEAGAQVLATNGAEMIIKIRTDMLIDLAALVEYADIACEEHVDSIVVPWLPREGAEPQKYDIPDFYFAGRTETMLQFFESQTRFGNADFANSVHLDIPLRYAFALDHAADRSGLRVSVALLKYFKGRRLTEVNREVLSRVISERFIAGPRTVFEQIVWRGHPWAQSNFDHLLFGARWHDSELLNTRTRWWGRIRDVLLADYGRAATVFFVATGRSPRWMLLADKVLGFALWPIEASRKRNKPYRLLSLTNSARARVSTLFRVT